MELNKNDAIGNPKAIIILSGKRKSGKDYIAEFLLKRFGSSVCIIRLSGPLKKIYAKEHNLDYERLLDASQYKEQHRADMIKWSEEIRNKDPGFFCHQAILQCKATDKSTWIISDARRKSDLDYFYNKYPSVTYSVRIKSSDEVRIKRGWIFTKGIDDAESECGLDDINSWDFVITNEGNQGEIDILLQPITKLLSEAVQK